MVRQFFAQIGNVCVDGARQRIAFRQAGVKNIGTLKGVGGTTRHMGEDPELAQRERQNGPLTVVADGCDIGFGVHLNGPEA